MKQVTIKITEEDIRGAKPGDMEECVIAKCLWRSFYKPFCFTDGKYLGSKSRTRYYNPYSNYDRVPVFPNELREYIEHFDKTGVAEEAQFEIMVPDYWSTYEV